MEEWKLLEVILEGKEMSLKLEPIKKEKTKDVKYFPLNI